MANVTIIPPAQVSAVTAGSSQTQSATEAGSSPVNLTPGAVLSGTITGKDSNGNFLLRTGQGTISLHSDTPLTYNSDVVIRLGSSGNNARIISVNGEPFATFSAPDAEASDSLSPALLAQTGAPDAAATSASINAVIVSAPAAEPTASATNAPALSSGSNVVIHVTAPSAGSTPAVASPATETQPANAVSGTTAGTAQIAAPQAAAVAEEPLAAASPPPANNAQQTAIIPNNALQSPSTTTSTTPVAQTTVLEKATAIVTPEAPPPVAATAPPENLPPANNLYAVYAKQSAAPTSTPAVPSPASPATPPAATTAAPQTAPAPASTPAPAATLIQGQVTSANANGTTTVQTPLGTVTLKADASGISLPLAPGTSVTIEVPPSLIPAQILSSAPATLTELANSWQTLNDIITVTQAGNPQAAQALTARLPQLGPEFAATSTSFIAAVASGNARKLLGDDVVETLRQSGRADLVEKFSSEAGTLSQAFNPSEQKPGLQPSWQSFFLPFVFQESVQQARLYVKRDNPKKGRGTDDKQGDDTRFVVEVELSELGPMQMDGLVRKKEQDIAFDLMIRSHTAFSKEQMADITDLYSGAAELTGFKGAIGFQVVKDFPVKPLEETLIGKEHGFVV